MIFINKKLKKSVNIFSNGSLLLTFTYTDLNNLSSINFSEKDIKSYERKFKTQSSKYNNNNPTKSIDYRKKMFK
jgi:hypothetical protein